ncbi:MAG: hypothetical protein PUC30_07985 [Lachnospiraceae bacterium]|nr:hypothetical protein [Lachnospiraceae bacterium]
MQEDTRRLLQECNSGCKMAINSMQQIQDYVTDEGLATLIRESTERHEKLEAESTKLLEENGEYEKEPGVMASAMSWLSTEMKMLVKRSDTEVAKIMMDGCNMGIQSIVEKSHEYANASEESKKLAERLVKEEELFMRDLKEYL